MTGIENRTCGVWELLNARLFGTWACGVQMLCNVKF